MSYKLIFTKDVQKDAEKIKNSGLKASTIELLNIIRENHFRNPPSYEKLAGELTVAYSKRINVKHRLVTRYWMMKKLSRF